jgi:hypothetical protein
MPDGSSPSPKTPRRKYGRRRVVPRAVKRAAKKLTPNHKRGFLDWYYTATSFGMAPFPITEAKIEEAVSRMAQTAPKKARARGVSWRTSTNALPEADRQALGCNENLPKPQAKRKLNAPAGTFSVLEDNLSAACAVACRARASDFDPQPADALYCKGLARRVLVVATMLWKHGLITNDVDLQELVSLDNQAKFLRIADELAREPDAKIYVSKDIAAIEFFAARIRSKDQ